MKALFQISLMELKLAFRNFIYVFFAFAFPPMMLLLFGSMYGNEPSQFYNGQGAVDLLTPAYIGMIMAVSGLMGLPLQLSEYRQHKVLKRFKATPISTGAIMIPHFLVNGLLCILGTILLVIVGKIVFNLHFWGNLLIFLIAFLLSVICIFSIGFLIAAVAPNSRAANAIAYLVYFPMLFLSGATVPLQVMPPEIVAFSKLLPLTHCVEILQGTWLGNPLSDFIKAIVILLAISIVCIGVSIKAFRWE